MPDINPYENRFVLWYHVRDDVYQKCNQYILMNLRPLEFQAFVSLHLHKKLISEGFIHNLFYVWLNEIGKENISPDDIAEYQRSKSLISNLQMELMRCKIALPGYCRILLDKDLLLFHLGRPWLYNKLVRFLRWRNLMDLYLSFYRAKTRSLDITKGKEFLYILRFNKFLKDNSEKRYSDMWSKKMIVKIRCITHKKTYILKIRDHYRRFGGCYQCKEDAKQICVFCGFRSLNLGSFFHKISDNHIKGEKNFIWLFSEKKLYDHLVYEIYRYTTSFVCAKLRKEVKLDFL